MRRGAVFLVGRITRVNFKKHPFFRLLSEIVRQAGRSGFDTDIYQLGGGKRPSENLDFDQRFDLADQLPPLGAGQAAYGAQGGVDGHGRAAVARGNGKAVAMVAHGFEAVVGKFDFLRLPADVDGVGVKGLAAGMARNVKRYGDQLPRLRFGLVERVENVANIAAPAQGLRQADKAEIGRQSDADGGQQQQAATAAPRKLCGGGDDGLHNAKHGDQ